MKARPSEMLERAQVHGKIELAKGQTGWPGAFVTETAEDVELMVVEIEDELRIKLVDVKVFV